MHVAKWGIGRRRTASTADETSRGSERSLRGIVRWLVGPEPDGGGEARASWDWHGKSRRQGTAWRDAAEAGSAASVLLVRPHQFVEARQEQFENRRGVRLAVAHRYVDRRRLAFQRTAHHGRGPQVRGIGGHQRKPARRADPG